MAVSHAARRSDLDTNKSSLHRKIDIAAVMPDQLVVLGGLVQASYWLGPALAAFCRAPNGRGDHVEARHGQD